MAAEEAKGSAASDSAKVNEALQAKKAAVHALAKTLHKAVKKEAAVASTSNLPTEKKEAAVHQDVKHAAVEASAAGVKQEEVKKAEAAAQQGAAAHRAHQEHQAKQSSTQALAEGKGEKGEEAKGAQGKEALAAKEVDPREKQRGKFGWLFKAAEKDADVTKKNGARAKQMKLQGGENATEEEGGEKKEEDAKTEAEDTLEAQKKKNKAEAAKALSFSEKSEVTFVVSLLVAVVCLFLVGLCCINYARFLITGKMEGPKPPQRPGPPPGMGGPPPGQGPGYERMN